MYTRKRRGILTHVRDELAPRYNKAHYDFLLEGIADVTMHDDCREMKGWEDALRKDGYRFALYAGCYRHAVTFMKAHPLAELQEVSAQDIAKYPIRINSGALFDVAKHTISKMFPPTMNCHRIYHNLI